MRKISIVMILLILIIFLSSFSCSTALDNGPQDEPQDIPQEDPQEDDTPEDEPEEIPNQDSIKIASFNIQIFGPSKASNQEVMDILVQIIRDFDIVAIQEIRNADGTAIITLKNQVNADGSSYDVVVGPRVGRSTSKEQYAYMYDTTVLQVLPNSYTYDDDGDGNDSNDIDDSTHLNDLFEREPFITHFKIKSGDFDFVLINIHTKPDDAENEIGYLPDVIADVFPHLNETDVVCLGDFNADGSYFDEATYNTIFPSTQYNWLITNSTDTTP